MPRNLYFAASDKILRMEQFHSERKAKEYLIGKLVEEAEREGKPLSEIERKMLYFTETGWTLPDMMEVNAGFERDYDNDDYERKICGLGQAIEAQLEGVGAAESDAWYAAIQKLSEGDHYLLVLLNPRLLPAATSKRSSGNLLKLSLITVGVVLGWLAFMMLGDWLYRSRFRAVMDWLFDRNHSYIVVLLACLIWALRSQIRGVFRR